MRIVTLPTHYSMVDRERRDALIAGLVELQRAYQRASQPFTDALVEIENRYPRNAVMVPEDGDPTPEWAARMAETLLTEEDAREEGDAPRD